MRYIDRRFEASLKSTYARSAENRGLHIYASSVRIDVVFDLDLTLIRSAPRESWLTVATRWGLSEAEADRSFQAGKGFATLVSVDAAFPSASERERRQIADEFNTVFVAAGSTEIEGASKVLATLAEAGHRLYLSTGAEPGVLEAALDRHGWGDMFDLALGSSADLPKGVGHLEQFARISGLSSLAEWARATLTVGDGPGEMGFGAQAGIAFRCAFVSEEDDEYVSLLRDAGANLRIRELREVAEVAAHSDPLSVASWSI